MANSGRGRGTLLLLAAIFFGPLVVAWLWFFGLDPQVNSTTNNGVLVQPPIPVSFDENVELEGFADEDYLRRKWTMLYLGDSRCDDSCRDDLFQMRQVRATLARRMERVQGLLLLTDNLAPSADFAAYLAKDHEGLRVEPANRVPRVMQAIADIQQRYEITKRAVIIIDPLGNLMMYFPEGTPPAKMQKDIKRLLKVSRVG